MAAKQETGTAVKGRRQPRSVPILLTLLVVVGGVYLSLPRSWFEIPSDETAVRRGSGPPAAPVGDLAALRAEAEKNPLDYLARSRYGMALASTGSSEQALEQFRSAQILAPENPVVYQNLGGWYLNQHQFAEADKWFSRALEFAPGSGRPHYLRGLALQGLQNHEAAVQQFKLAVSLEPGFPDAYLSLAMQATKLEPEQRIVGWVEEYVRLSGNRALGDYVLSGAYKTWRKFDAAARYGDSSVKLDPGNYAYWHNLGQVYYYNRRFDDAERTLAKAQSLTPKPGTVLIERGMNAQNAGRFAEAITRFKEALESTPESGVIHIYLARNYQRLGDTAAAAKEEAAYRSWERGMHEVTGSSPVKTMPEKQP